MQVDPESARTVAAVLDEGSFEGAARRLLLTPSAVSQRIKTLEQQLGRILLVRSKPARATEAGEAVARFGRQVALLERDAIAGFGLAGEAEGARVRIPLAVNADSMATWFLTPLARLSERHDVEFDLHRDDQNFTARLLESGTVMAAVTSESEPVGGCRVEALGALRYVAAASPAFARRWFPEGVTADALSLAPFVDFDRRDLMQQDWLRARGVDPWAVPRHHVPASADFSIAVELGLGWALLPVPHAEPGLADGRLVRLDDAETTSPLFWQQWNLRSELLDAIAAEIRAAAGRVLR
ncbi:LysR family transcriptional regulator ArgP [Microbacterium azadirachtae]|uniref:Putative HTH-type transcriptional regulator n=1 Tax=Microbacterium azadirachtae TaxID=582680 RepID=A0A0F0KVP2_9MICO|nr:LysR family transcriptional regulator ArgP [Microbacterium azadirachtae]KJL23301.1 putative HTH-type transcriptional regulator [Microbacterium azadirachtae]UXW86746.1 LysR family transcriptional regulator ArgP [Microbacterium azadirachtae]SDM38260.1 LysR family transcriptional regulator, chromosome initiation inhibitor [Microbacterium azadirachtae]SEG54043.1 LysR family transcriptional regulator, chromosome initiation inhibitor [Microbacterium azadirachtae]SEG56922.1 LysR family transcripti